MKNDSQRAGPEATTQIVNIVRNVVDHASERSKIKDQHGRRHGAVAALICQQLGNALMRESIGGNTVDGIGGHHNRVVRLQRLAGSFDGLAGLSFSRYGVQLCSHGLILSCFSGCGETPAPTTRHVEALFRGFTIFHGL